MHILLWFSDCPKSTSQNSLFGLCIRIPSSLPSMPPVGLGVTHEAKKNT